MESVRVEISRVKGEKEARERRDSEVLRVMEDRERRREVEVREEIERGERGVREEKEGQIVMMKKRWGEDLGNAKERLEESRARMRMMKEEVSRRWSEATAAYRPSLRLTNLCSTK